MAPRRRRLRLQDNIATGIPGESRGPVHGDGIGAALGFVGGLDADGDGVGPSARAISWTSAVEGSASPGGDGHAGARRGGRRGDDGVVVGAVGPRSVAGGVGVERADVDPVQRQGAQRGDVGVVVGLAVSGSVCSTELPPFFWASKPGSPSSSSGPGPFSRWPRPAGTSRRSAGRASRPPGTGTWPRPRTGPRRGGSSPPTRTSSKTAASRRPPPDALEHISRHRPRVHRRRRPAQLHRIRQLHRRKPKRHPPIRTPPRARRRPRTRWPPRTTRSCR